jgi:multidrug resistance efflux pump
MDREPYPTDTADLLGKRAGWAYRNGHILLFTTAAILLVGAYGYRYPATVRGTLELSTVDPPRKLIARQDMQISRVWVNDRDTVVAGQVLLAAEDGTARLEHVLDLEDRLLDAQREGGPDPAELALPIHLVLGPVDASVRRFRDRQDRLRILANRELGRYGSSELAAMIAREENRLRRRRERLNARERQLAGLRDEETNLPPSATTPGERRNLRGRIAGLEEEVQREREAVRSSRLDIELMRNQVASYQTGSTGSLTEARAQLSEAFTALRSAVARWKQDYTLVSPVAGVVLLQPSLREDNFLPRGQLAATVLPHDAGSTIGQVSLPVRGSGGVAPGQKVVVRFDKYPHLEYGVVTGEVGKVGVVPVGDRVAIEITFPGGLITTKGKQLEATPFLRGEATVITGTRSLLNILLDPF